MWCEASLTGFSHMMLYQQAANERKCPGKIQGKCFNYFGTFSKMVDTLFIYFLDFFLKLHHMGLIYLITIEKRRATKVTRHIQQMNFVNLISVPNKLLFHFRKGYFLHCQ